MKKKTTVTIGIPAYNEEKNIINMLKSVIKQKQCNFILEKIVVVSDGSSDKTEELVRKLSRKYPIISLIVDKKRLGKSQRLNQLYKLNKSDFLGTFDADIVLERDIELEFMVQEISKDKKINVVAANQIPTKPKSFMGKFSRMSFLMIYEAAKKFRDGNNIHCLQGSSSIIRKSFAKKLRIPEGVTVDQGYLYVSSILKDRRGFSFVHRTRIIFNPISSFRDWRILGLRTLISDKNNLGRVFSNRILREYYIPKNLIYEAIIKCFYKNPIETIGAIVMNIFIRAFPLNRNYSLHAAGIWEIVESSKEAIRL